MPHYFLNVLASQDLEKIANYFESTNLEAGENFFSKFKSQCRQLIASSNNGKSHAEFKINRYELSFEDYFIYYRILDNGVEILRVSNVY